MVLLLIQVCERRLEVVVLVRRVVMQGFLRAMKELQGIGLIQGILILVLLSARSQALLILSQRNLKFGELYVQ